MVRRSINLRVLIISVVAAAAVGGALFLVQRWQVSRTATGLIALADAQEKAAALAEEVEQAAAWFKAAEYLDRYLRLRPDDGATRVRLAQTFNKGVEAEGEITDKKPRATELYYRAIAADVKDRNSELRRELSELLLDTGRFSEAEKEADAVLKEVPQSAQGLRVKAMAKTSQVADGSLTGLDISKLQLLTLTVNAQKANPSDIDLALRLALLYREFPQVVRAEESESTEPDRRRKADDCLDKLVRDNPKSAKAYLARYNYRTTYGLPDADGDLDLALQLAEKDPEALPKVLLTAGDDALRQAERVLRAKGDPTVVQDLVERSRSRYEEVVKLTEKRPIPQASIGLGAAWLLANDLDKAVAAWREGMQQLTEKYKNVAMTTLIEFQRRIAEACTDGNRLSEAEVALKEIDVLLENLTGVPRELHVQLIRQQDLRQARYFLRKGDLKEALPKLALVVNTHAGGSANLQMSLAALWIRGNTLAAIGEWREAAATYSEAAKLQPTWQEVRIAAANSWLFAGRPDESSAQADAALNIAETPAAWMSLAIAQLQVQNAQLPAQRNWRRLEQAIAALEKSRDKLESNSPWQIDVLHAEFVISKAKSAGDAAPGIQEANGILHAAESRYGKEQRFWQQICLAYQALQMQADADRALAEFGKAGGKAPEVTLMEAHLANLRQDYPRAKTLLNQALAKATPVEQPPLRAELLRVALASKDLPTARQMMLAEQKQNPTSVGLLRRLIEIDLELKDYESVKTWEQALRSAGEHAAPMADYYGAWRILIATKSNDDPALSAALETSRILVKNQPQWAEAVALRALLEHRLNLRDEAIRDYELAVQLGERRVFVFEQMIALLGSLGRSEDVDRYLARLEADLPLTQRLTELAGRQEMDRHERPERALEIARKNVALRPDDGNAHLWLGRLLQVNQRNTEAEQVYLKAEELSRANPEMPLALAAFYYRTDQREKLHALLARVQQNDKLDKAQRELLAGQLNEYLGELEAAKTSYMLAAKQAEHDLTAQLRVAQFFMQTDPQQAKVHLEKALQIDSKSVAAKRMLAIVHVALGDLPAAEQLLASAQPSGVAEAEDVRLNVLLLMQQSGQANLRRAVNLMEDIVDREKVQSMDRLLLSRLYEQQAQIADDAAAAKERLTLAEKQLLVLGGDPQADPTQLAALVQFFTRHELKESAAKWVDSLEKRVAEMPKKNADRYALLIQTQVLAGLADRSEKWLVALGELEPTSLRPVALRALVAQTLDSKFNVETLIEPQAAKLLAEAKTPIEKQRVYGAVGDVYVGLKSFPAAERWYRLLSAEVPKSFPTVVGTLARQGRLSDAIDLCEQVAKTDESVQPAFVLATTLVQSVAKPTDYQRAEPLFAAALRKFDTDIGLLNAMALVRIAQGQDAEAVRLYRQIVKMNPRSVAALNNLAMILAERPVDRTEALRLIDEAISIAGSDPGLLDTKGAILVYSGRSREALPLLESATRDSKADPRHHFHLALAYRDQGKTEEAKSQLKTALDRQLADQLLTPTDQKLLGDLRAALQL